MDRVHKQLTVYGSEIGAWKNYINDYVFNYVGMFWFKVWVNWKFIASYVIELNVFMSAMDEIGQIALYSEIYTMQEIRARFSVFHHNAFSYDIRDWEHSGSEHKNTIFRTCFDEYKSMKRAQQYM